MNKTKIEWTDYTWNPVTGCEHNCWYCYAKKIAMRFRGNFTPTFHSERFDDFSPQMRIKKDLKIFVCSMADLFGDWVKREWIDEVIKIANTYQGYTFQFLTKNPKRYLDFNFSENCWLGVTITGLENNTQELINLLKQKNNYKFISFEPLMADIRNLDLSGIDLVIIGGMTGNGNNNIKPEKEWMKIKHENIFFKKNLTH
jgi:protein gp37